MTDTGRARDGYFVIADISGYTAFLTGTELEHAQAIIVELLTGIIDSLTPPLTRVRVEGDAVFCRADAGAFDDAERLLELLEVSYVEFQDRLETMARATTCTCAACASISSLDLKFVAHFGSFVVHQIAGIDEIAGADVITTHRLLKNAIREQTGCAAYVFLTDAVTARCATKPVLPPHMEEYESIGAVRGSVSDLRVALATRRAARREYLNGDDADLVVKAELPAPPEVVWPWLIEPAKVPAWNKGMLRFESKKNAQGRLGVGAESHCAHGSWASVIRYTDWRPYTYFSTHLVPTKTSFDAAPAMRTTTELTPTADQRTQYEFRILVDDRGRLMRMKLALLRPLMRREMNADLRKLALLIDAELRSRRAMNPDRPGDDN